MPVSGSITQHGSHLLILDQYHMLQYHSTSDGLDILSLFLFLSASLMPTSKESTYYTWVSRKDEELRAFQD